MTWEEIQTQAAQLEVSFEEAGDGWICLIKHESISGLFQESKAGIAAALDWLAQLRRMMELADRKRGTIMSESDREFEDLRQTYGELYEHSDYSRGAHIRYTAYDGEIRSGEILWVQEPGVSYGKDGTRWPLKAQYVVQIENPPADSLGIDFVNLSDVITE